MATTQRRAHSMWPSERFDGRVVLLSSLLLILGCKDNPGGTGDDFAQIDFRPGTYDIYEWTFSQSDSSGQMIVLARDTFAVTCAATGEQIDTLTNLMRFKAYQIRAPLDTMSVWYRSDAAQFTEVAYAAAGYTPPVVPVRRRTVGRIASGIVGPSVLEMPYLVRLRLGIQPENGDSVIVRDDPRIVYKLPLTVGSSWTSFQSPFLETREVTGFQSASVRGGDYDCAVISTKLPTMDPSLEWDDFVSHGGVVLREIRLRIIASTEENPEVPVDTLQGVERMELISRWTDH